MVAVGGVDSGRYTSSSGLSHLFEPMVNLSGCKVPGKVRRGT